MGDRHALAAYRDLGRMLRKVRKAAGMSETALARRLDWHLIMISRMETGFRPSTTTDVVQYLVGCGIRSQKEMRPFVEFTRHAELKQGYHLSDYRIDGSLQSLIFHESSAENLIIYEPQMISGLLQTPAYARALITAIDHHGEERVTAAVRTRMNRQRILSRSHHARFTFYLNEQALRLRVGTDEIMHEQLLHLVLTAAMDNITVRILPSAAGARTAFGDSFRLMEFREHRPIVYLDNLRAGGLILEDPGYVTSYLELVPMIADVALDEGQSRKFAADLADAYDRGSQLGAAVVLAEEQLHGRRGDRLCGSGMAESPTPIYEV